MRWLVLWDIDHTLVENNGVSKAIYLSAYRDLVGRPACTTPVTEGRTDRRIMHNLFEATGVPLPAWSAVESALELAGAAHLQVLRETGWALPGAIDAIRALAKSDVVVQGILTGNIRRNAQVKLAAFGMDEAFDFDLGAYGADGADRPELVDVARLRIREKTGHDFAGKRTILVGDTPQDVRAALLSNARIIAVASGKYSTKALSMAGAKVVLPDLLDTEAFVTAVLDKHSRS